MFQAENSFLFLYIIGLPIVLLVPVFTINTIISKKWYWLYLIPLIFVGLAIDYGSEDWRYERCVYKVHMVENQAVIKMGNSLKNLNRLTGQNFQDGEEVVLLIPLQIPYGNLKLFTPTVIPEGKLKVNE
ncbi:MAG: hypothetical protein ACHQ1D_00610 [Nitrososphaerales archaeon]